MPEPQTTAAFVWEDVPELDKNNAGWTKKYVAGLTERLERERGGEPSDPVMIAYLENELVTYQSLLDQVDANKQTQKKA